MIAPTEWALVCDQAGCDRTESHTLRAMLRIEARQEGWQLDVKLNGERAKRGGKDYCPDHHKP